MRIQMDYKTLAKARKSRAVLRKQLEEFRKEVKLIPTQRWSKAMVRKHNTLKQKVRYAEQMVSRFTDGGGVDDA